MILDRERKFDPPLPPVAEQPLELIDFLGRRDDQDLAQARHHQRGQRVVDQRLVVDRQQLLRRRQGERVKTGSAATCQNDAFAVHASGSSWLPGIRSGLVSMRQGARKLLSATCVF
jgi:hypothetical protein